MVHQLQFWNRRRTQALVGAAVIAWGVQCWVSGPGAGEARADSQAALAHLKDAQSLFNSGDYYKAARYAFSATEEDPTYKAEGYSWITLSLIRAGYTNAASYFFIRTLQSGNQAATRRVLTETATLLDQGGEDLLRKYLIRHTTYNDYNPANRSAYLYSLGKDALLSGRLDDSIGYLNGVQHSARVYPYALQLRGSAYAIQGKNDSALRDFKECQDRASDLTKGASHSTVTYRQRFRQSEDLQARCTAGEARTFYQMEKFREADRVYDSIPKGSFVWPDILFEQAWNSFARQEYNRTLGKLVSYKSPALSFVFNSEIDVLRSQAYLALCLYDDANSVINEFNSKYAPVGEQVKRFVEGNVNNLPAFYAAGRAALHGSLSGSSDFNRFLNRFVRSPYFEGMVQAEKDATREISGLRQLGANTSQGFPGFLDHVLRWRIHSIQLLGGAYIKNSMLDYHAALISNFEKMAFIKLEMLRRAKDKLMNISESSSDRLRGNIEPSRRDDQYYWSFNGEFWNDELGDYVFGLESKCEPEKR